MKHRRFLIFGSAFGLLFLVFAFSLPWERAAPDGFSLQSYLALFNPEPESQVFIPRELDGREGRIVFSAAHRPVSIY